MFRSIALSAAGVCRQPLKIYTKIHKTLPLKTSVFVPVCQFLSTNTGSGKGPGDTPTGNTVDKKMQRVIALEAELEAARKEARKSTQNIRSSNQNISSNSSKKTKGTHTKKDSKRRAASELFADFSKDFDFAADFGDSSGSTGTSLPKGWEFIQSKEQYDNMIESLTQESISQDDSAEPCDEFLRSMDPVRFYKRAVDQCWEENRCFCCGTDHTGDVHFMNVPLLHLFVSSAGNILPRSQTKLCAKHQRKMARTIKHARQMAMMPYIGNVASRKPFKWTHQPEETQKQVKDFTAKELEILEEM